MEHKELLRRLRKLSKAITLHIDRVNWGGCAVVAGLAGKHLQAQGVMVEVVTSIGWGGMPAGKIRHRVSNTKDPQDWSNNGLSRSHLAIRFRSGRRTYTWDSDGVLAGAGVFGKAKTATTPAFGDGLSVQECIEMSRTGRGWNPDFDRKQIPMLRHLVQHHLGYGL